MPFARGGAPLTNFYGMPEPTRGEAGYNTEAGKTSGSPSGQINILTYGQSLNCNNNTGSGYAPTNAASIFDLNPYTGSIFRLAEPVLGCSGDDESFWPQVADGLIDDTVATQVLVCNVSAGGAAIADFGQGGAVHQRLITGFRRFRQLGLTIHLVHQAQGEYDALIGTTQGAYAASNAALISWFRTNFGYTGPWMINKESWVDGAAVTAIQNAQTGLVDNVTIFAGADMDTMNDTFRTDGTHLGNTGIAQAAVLHVAAIGAVL
jgi:hypothetical protein